MDTLAHGLWAGLMAKGNNQSKAIIWWTAFFGTLPDLVGFGWVFALFFYQKLFLNQVIEFGKNSLNNPTISLWSDWTYLWGHSVVIWLLVFALVYILSKKIFWPMFGWLLHIIIDIPTHTIDFYPTPFLWPLSDYRFGGFSWGQGWFMALNYGSLLVVFVWLKYFKKN